MSTEPGLPSVFAVLPPRRAAVALFLLAPMVGEFVLGNIPVSGLPSLVVLAPVYGGAAVLIRVAARRTGRGWPTMLLLGAAFGVLIAGLLDQSLFNPAFEEYSFQEVTPVPALGISAYHSYTFVVGHAVWSIGVPIALVEGLTWRHGTTPWLGRTGLVVTAVVFAAGSLLLWRIMLRAEGFLATGGQRIGAALVVLALVAVAFLLKPSARVVDRAAPRPWAVGVFGFLASSLHTLVPASWGGLVTAVAVLVLASAVVRHWSHRAGWGPVHRFALAGGIFLTYTWLGWVLVEKSTGPLVAHAALVLLAWAFLAVAARSVVRGGSSGTRPSA